jgi:hypothetical protein
MNPSFHWRKVLRLAASGAVLGLSVQGGLNVWRNLVDVHTLAQWLMSLWQAGYALLGPMVVLMWWRGARGAKASLLAWSILFVGAVALIPLAWLYAGAGRIGPFLLAGLAAAAVVVAGFWCSGLPAQR